MTLAHYTAVVPCWWTKTNDETPASTKILTKCMCQVSIYVVVKYITILTLQSVCNANLSLRTVHMTFRTDMRNLEITLQCPMSACLVAYIKNSPRSICLHKEKSKECMLA